MSPILESLIPKVPPPGLEDSDVCHLLALPHGVRISPPHHDLGRFVADLPV